MKQGIIFDMDGTLWDSADGVAKSWTQVIHNEYKKDMDGCDRTDCISRA